MRTERLFHGYTIQEDGLIHDPKGNILIPFDFNGYDGVCIKSIKYYVHRLVAHVFVRNPSPKFRLVDHIDRNKHNNVFSNLRWSNHVLNGLNNDAKNAYRVKKFNKWVARVRNKTLGYYRTYEEAHAVAKAYRLELSKQLYKDACTQSNDESSTCFSETSVRCPTLVS